MIELAIAFVTGLVLGGVGAIAFRAAIDTAFRRGHAAAKRGFGPWPGL